MGRRPLSTLPRPHMPFLKEPPYKHGSTSRSAVVLVNLGTPDAPTAPAVRRYLKQFLSDPRVVEIPRRPIIVGLRAGQGYRLHSNNVERRPWFSYMMVVI